jgi:signal transduction histidine kinase
MKMKQNFQRYNTIINQSLQWIVFVYQIMAVVIFMVAIYLGMHWVQIPFLGAFVEHSMVFNGVGPTEPSAAWELFQEVKLGDQLVKINDIPVTNSSQMQDILQNYFPGASISATVRSENGQERVLALTLQKFPPSDRTTYFVIPSIVSFLFLVVSWWIFGLRRTETAGRAFSLFAASLAIVIGSTFDVYTTHVVTYIWTLSAGVAGGALVTLALSFPQELRITLERPYLRWTGLVLGLALAFLAFSNLYNFEKPTAYIRNWQYIYIYVAASVLFYILLNLYHSFYASSPVVKTQARLILWGSSLSFGPLLIWLLISFVRPLNFSPYLFLPILLFPLVVSYTIMRFRFVRSDNWIRHSLIYAVFAVVIVVGYALLVTGLGLVFAGVIPANSPIWVGIAFFLIALVFDAFRANLQRLVDAVFFRGQRAYAERLKDFSHQLTTVLDLRSIGAILRQLIASTLSPDQVHIYTYDPLNDQFAALATELGRPSSDIRFGAASPLARYFAKEKLPLYLDGASMPESLKLEQSRLNLLRARLFIALPGKEIPTGWLALGPRLSGQPYTPQDLSFLENISDQASLAIERVQIVANLERRVQEMNALTRVSQGVNITLTFDDVLELIYAQTAQIIPTSHFHITLHNKANDFYYYGFCVENGERLQERENIPFPPNTGLGTEVIRKGRPILTQDHGREAQARNITPNFDDVYAWMGVPLNAGAESIGSLSVGNADSSTAYTRAQLDLLHAIADQTAGAIVKARLLQETQQRAHQLSTLNEVTRQLTSTLELEPLLQNILENAVGILNCEAGSLFLIDEQTDELIFKVTAGPVAKDLLGQRLPPGSGIVGRAIAKRGPVIENNAQGSLSRFPGTDKQTGFVTRALMATPLEAKDRVIGVIEVINRRDGLPFVEDDQNLLSAFAGQAAVAIENARLYTLTDQELAARVEELSVMQRIDRELNASLEIDRAMRITLEWAMRQSRAEAGLIGMLSGDRLQIMASQGYEDYMATLPDHMMKIEIPSIQAAIESGQPQRVVFRPASGSGILASSVSQFVIPIRRELQVIGLLMLESSIDTQEKEAPFLNRLSDHAAIAISNAQLFGEVQRANIAKSEFVSFVAHELKNPMTSIKGYTELLAGGKVGQISDMQANFLKTIRSNVERMSTLVSDLNDNSKIEAGRLRLDFKATKVDELLDDVIRSTKRQIEDKKQEISIAAMEQLPSIWADGTRVGQVLTNLVSNANKYTPEGGRIMVGAEAVDNQWDREGAARVVHISVKDSGIGISVEDQQKIFQKFFRSDDSKAREAPGTGLGLNITKSLVEMQGGKIWFESEFRIGTTFHFTIPIAEG